jgi:hypothetical protein
MYILFQSGQKVRILMLIELSEKDAALRRKSLTKGKRHLLRLIE